MRQPLDSEFIQLIRKMNNVERLAGSFKHRSYNLTEHSFFVMQLFIEIAESEEIPYTAKDVILASRHDALETITGDLLYPVKNCNGKTKDAWALIEAELIKEYPVFEEYSDEALKSSFSHPQLHNVMKCADLLELWVFCIEEEIMGNSSLNLARVIRECEKLLFGPYNYKGVITFMKEYKVD